MNVCEDLNEVKEEDKETEGSGNFEKEYVKKNVWILIVGCRRFHELSLEKHF